MKDKGRWRRGPVSDPRHCFRKFCPQLQSSATSGCSPSPDLVAMTQLLLLIVALLVLGHVPPGRSEFKRCWKGQGACRPYCTRHEAYMQLCPDASLCCLAYGLKMAKIENV
uniref:Beta-defensin n=1 Tax=Sus scrofa TaxID=9823 RepID=A0A8W4FQP1_PIG